MRRRGNEVCPSFLSQLSHLLSLTHCLSYIVSCLIRTRVSVKCLDFDIMHTAIPCTGNTADQAVSTVHVQLGAAKHLTRPLTCPPSVITTWTLLWRS